MSERIPDVDRPPQPPGEAIRAAMADHGWTQSDLAYVLGVTTATVNQVLGGKRGVSHNMAKALGLALNIQPKLLVDLQADWDLYLAEEPASIVSIRARILTAYPLREMIKRGWIPETDDPSILERRVCKLFGARTLDEIPSLSFAAKKTKEHTTSPAEQAWMFRVKQIAHEMQAPAFSASKLEQALSRLSDARGEPEGVRHVPRLLQEAGVRFVVVEDLPSSQIDGVCIWLHDKAPVVGMSLRFDRIDNFWFVMRHECAHALHGHGKDNPSVDSDLTGTIGREVNEEERLANTDAAEFCIPQDKMTSFYLRKKPLFTERDVLAFAKRMDVHPGLVVGQLHWRTDRYDFLRKHLVRVRDILARTTMMDGWGDVIPTEQ